MQSTNLTAFIVSEILIIIRTLATVTWLTILIKNIHIYVNGVVYVYFGCHRAMVPIALFDS